ncbi:MAG: ATP-dependent RNA helicase HrpA [Ilumatobacteraceae bacterium]
MTEPTSHQRRRRRPRSERIDPARYALAREARAVARAAVDLHRPDELPISARADDLVAAIRDHRVVIVAGETGSGKSTQLPKLCLEAGRGVDGMIGHTQPRRVAARTVAERVASELGTQVGAAVGYSVRFDDRVGDSTLLRVMTDGILLNELQRDPSLSRYDTIIIDEAHERSLNIDFLLGYLRRLLERRDDLHVVVTSATIDTDRFARHFAGADGEPAPVFVVEGRTYPVEIRYRPFGDDAGDRRDQVRAVLDAIDELAGDGPGDVLVFLSGEREIHDVADALRSDRTADVESGRLEVMPLYARLSASEQHRIFQPHGGRRIVLSTNVAETSITVPGVRYVVDAGTARISRYSRRLKVQRLPIEPVSQASADQRAGRCGRVAPGVCIRLYAEADFVDRPEFTEPEILRTNLASVILQMTAIGLGEVEQFPFVEPPDGASIRDGWLLLDELGALQPTPPGAPRRLTGIGRRLARLPVDPRLGRMVIEADRLGCVREVLVIAAALSIQDVRERPRDSPGRADEFHARFRVDGSDLLSIVALWDHLRAQQRELSGNRFRRMCHDEYLHYLRVREWSDLYSQLRQVAGQIGIRSTVDVAHPDHVHRAVLAGLLSHVGVRDGEGRDYRGARDARFVIAPGSVLTRRPPRWVMAAELVETDQLRARRVASIRPEWIEPLAPHLVKRSYGDAWWDARSARAVTRERVTLFGLPIVDDRTVGLDRADPSLARQMFIRHALVEGDWNTRHGFVERNRRFVERVRLLEARVRRGDLLDDGALEAFYDARVDASVTSGRHFDRWWKDVARTTPELLDLSPSVLADRSGIDLAEYPDTWAATDGASGYRLVYRYEPGTALDGVAVEVPLTSLNQFDGTGLDWSIPGRRHELVGELVRTLPKDLRRSLIPMSDTVDAVHAELGPPVGRLVDRLAEIVGGMTGRSVRPEDFDVERLPTHLRTHVVVVHDGVVVDAGDDVAAIVARQSGAVRSAIARETPVVERRGIVGWDVGTLEQTVEHRTPDGRLVRAYPALLDRGDSVSLRLVDDPDLQQRVMRGGVRRLLVLLAAPNRGRVRRSVPDRILLGALDGTVDVDALVDDCVTATVDAILARHGLPWDAEAFDRVAGAVRTDGPGLAADAFAVAVEVLAAASRVRRRLTGLTAEPLGPTVADVGAHLGRLVAAGFVTRSGTDRLPDVHRYVRGIEYRLDHLAGDLARDRRRIDDVRPVESAYAELVGRFAPVPDRLRSIAWSIEELRMSVFAQPVGVVGPVSAARIRRSMAEFG